MTRPPDEPETTTPARRDYEFDRGLTADEEALLTWAIAWRQGSAIRRNAFGRVSGCTAHPDDLATFMVEQRKQKREAGDGSPRLKAMHVPKVPA